MIINKNGKKERIVFVVNAKDYSNSLTPEDNEKFNKKSKDINKLLLLKQRDILNYLFHEFCLTLEASQCGNELKENIYLSEEDLYSNKISLERYKLERYKEKNIRNKTFSFDRWDDREDFFSDSYKDYFYSCDFENLISDINTCIKEGKDLLKNKDELESRKMELFQKIQEITNQFEWYYDIALKKLHFSFKDGKRGIETDLLNLCGEIEIEKMILHSPWTTSYSHFINKTFQGLNNDIKISPTSQKLNEEFKNLLDIIIDNDSNSEYYFEFKKVNSTLDRIVLGFGYKEKDYVKSNKNNLILEIKEEEKSPSGYSIFIGLLDKENIERKNGILFNSNSFVSLIDNGKKTKEFELSEIIKLLQKSKKNFTFTEKGIVNSLKSINKSVDLSK